MIKYLDNFLNSITMYRLVMYCLITVAVFAVLFGFLGLLDYSGWSLLVSVIIFIVSCYLINLLFSRLLKTPSTGESSVISGIILFLIFQPAENMMGLAIIFLASLVAMASKYIIAWRRKHVFNPAALAAVVFGFTGFGAAWWVTNIYMFPIVLIMGLLITRKTRRFYVVLSFLIGFFIAYFMFFDHEDIIRAIINAFLYWPIVFFGTIMLIEPTTLPPRIRQQILYGFLIGIFFANPVAIVGSIYTSPEITLVLANIVSFFLGLKRKIKMVFEEKLQIAKNCYEFIFRPDNVLNFRAGQYLEWSLPHVHQDVRGIRRYFTIASAPKESFVKIGIKFNDKSSTFKQFMQSLKRGQILFADNLMGDFFIPTKIKQKYVFIAGGIGVTPFISIFRDLANKSKQEDIILFYANKTKEDTAYVNLLEESKDKIGAKLVYLMDAKSDFADEEGFLNEKIIEKYAPDFKERVFYLSGPEAMVDNYKHLIMGMGVPRYKIKTDYFPGF